MTPDDDPVSARLRAWAQNEARDTWHGIDCSTAATRMSNSRENYRLLHEQYVELQTRYVKLIRLERALEWVLAMLVGYILFTV
jgi:hypothetical protein